MLAIRESMNIYLSRFQMDLSLEVGRQQINDINIPRLAVASSLISLWKFTSVGKNNYEIFTPSGFAAWRNETHSKFN